jgi:hypothetical protein
MEEATMANGDSGGVGVLGVLIGALIVIVVGGGILFGTGVIGGKSQQKSAGISIQLPTSK